MKKNLRTALNELTNPQIEFICDECGYSRDDLFALSESNLYEVYDRMCDIELEEISDDGEESERCKISSDIVDLLGNAIAEAEGLIDEEEFERELNED